MVSEVLKSTKFQLWYEGKQKSNNKLLLNKENTNLWLLVEIKIIHSRLDN